jgi:hypothetical protein
MAQLGGNPEVDNVQQQAAQERRQALDVLGRNFDVNIGMTVAAA